MENIYKCDPNVTQYLKVTEGETSLLSDLASILCAAMSTLGKEPWTNEKGQRCALSIFSQYL